VYGAWGVHLANRQIKISEKADSTSISIDTFKSLLLKTDVLINHQVELLEIYRSELEQLKFLVCKSDTTINIASKHLRLNESNEKIKALSEYENLLGACYLMHNLRREYNMAKRDSQLAYFYLLKQRIRVLKTEKEVMERQISNPALMKNGALLNKWWRVYDYVLDRYTIDDIRMDGGREIDSAGFASFNAIMPKIDTIIDLAAQYATKEIIRMKKEMKIPDPVY
jgi:hypothetical protein